MTETLAQLSTVFLYAAMGLYAAAFIAFALDLARRGARATAVEAAVVPSAVARRAEVATPVGAPSATLIGGGTADVPPPPASALGRLSSRISTRVEDDVMNGSGGESRSRGRSGSPSQASPSTSWPSSCGASRPLAFRGPTCGSSR
ncbi:hypothetical protein [Leifsonia xyli]|uniref:hypothetical protein n=1 Tax=Leifsonia xyli TaxID=1575 RepID=UPI003D6696E9